MIVEMVFPIVPMVDVTGETVNAPKYLWDESGPTTLYRWELVEEFDPHTPSWRMRIRLYTDDPAVLGRLRAKPDVQEVE